MKLITRLRPLSYYKLVNGSLINIEEKCSGIIKYNNNKDIVVINNFDLFTLNHKDVVYGQVNNPNDILSEKLKFIYGFNNSSDGFIITENKTIQLKEYVKRDCGILVPNCEKIIKLKGIWNIII